MNEWVIAGIVGVVALVTGLGISWLRGVAASKSKTDKPA